MPSPKALAQAEREYWNRLNDFIRRNGGWTTSEPHTSLIRFECLPSSILPELLGGRGYDVIGAGTGERLLPTSHTIKQTGNVTSMTVQNVAPATVEIFQFKLPF